MTTWFTSDWHLGHKKMFDFCDRNQYAMWQQTGGSVVVDTIPPVEKKITEVNVERSLRNMMQDYFAMTADTVKPEDSIYFLGDMVFTGRDRRDFLHFVDGLDCAKKVLISGNHDKTWEKHKEQESEVFDDVYIQGQHPFIDIQDQTFRLSHLPNSDYGDERDWRVDDLDGPYNMAGDKPCLSKSLRPDMTVPIICGHVHEKWRIWHQPFSQSYNSSTGFTKYHDEVWQFNCGVDANDYQLVSGETILREYERRYVKQ